MRTCQLNVYYENKLTFYQMYFLVIKQYQSMFMYIAEDVEKRWSALRDMFSRKERKKKLALSGSDRSESKEWHLY